MRKLLTVLITVFALAHTVQAKATKANAPVSQCEAKPACTNAACIEVRAREVVELQNKCQDAFPHNDRNFSTCVQNGLERLHCGLDAGVTE